VKPKFTGLILLNAGGIAVDHISFRVWISGVVSEIFAIKFESCRKSHGISDVFFTLPNFKGGGFQRLYPCYHPCLALRRVEKLHEDTPTTPISPKVIAANTLNFRPNFEFSWLKVFFLGGGDPRPHLCLKFKCVSIQWCNSPSMFMLARHLLYWKVLLFRVDVRYDNVQGGPTK